MARAGTLTVRVIGDTGPFEDKMSRLSGKLNSLGNKLTMGLTAPLAIVGGKAVQAAESLGESVNAVNTVFGDAADKIFEFGDTASSKVGLAKREVNEAATVLGSSLINAGLSADEAADKTLGLTERAADMASVFNTDVGSALEAIQSALRGETDPIEKFGVSMNAAKIEAKGLEMGLYDGVGAMDDQAKAAAAMQLIMEQTERVAGDFAETSDETANAQRIAKARTEDLAASFGEKLLPVKAKLLEVGGKLLDWFGNLDESGQQTVIMAAGIVAALGPVLKVVSGLITVIRGVSTAMAFLAANPVVLLIIAIGLLVAGLVIAYQKSEAFREIVHRAFEAVMDAGKRMAANVIGAVAWLVDKFLWAAESIVGAAATAFGWIPGIGDKLKGARDAIGRFREQTNEELAKVQNELRIDADTSPAQRAIRALRDQLRAIGASTITVGGTRGGLVMHSGGVVPGRPGQEVPAILEAGETVIPAGARIGGGGAAGERPIIVEMHLDRHKIGEAMISELVRRRKAGQVSVSVS